MEQKLDPNLDADKVARINRIVGEQLGVQPERIEATHNLEEEFNADSLDLVELSIALEDEFQIEIPDEVTESWKTVADVYNHIAKIVIL